MIMVCFSVDDEFIVDKCDQLKEWSKLTGTSNVDTTVYFPTSGTGPYGTVSLELCQLACQKDVTRQATSISVWRASMT